MKVNGNLDLQNNFIKQMRLDTEQDFPVSPQPGRFFFRESDRTLYLCASISGGLPIWVPLTTIRSMFRYTQATTALEWTIPHNLNISPVLIQVYDTTGAWIVPNEIRMTNNNNALLKFNTAVAGTAIVMRGQVIGTDGEGVAYEQTFASSTTWVVNHGLGYNPDIKVYVDNKQVQPASIVHNSVNQATVTFTTAQAGFVRAF